MNNSSALFMFDLDGTLVNTLDEIVLNVNKARTSFGFEAREVSEIKNLVGLNPVSFFEDLNANSQEINQMVKIFRENLNVAHFGAQDVYPGIEALLNFLINKDIELAVATNKPTQNAKLLLKKTGLLNFFSHVQGSDNLTSKPAPDILIACQNNFSVSLNFMVGDRVEDIQAGRASGAATIGVAQTAHSLEELRDAHANFVFIDANSLLNYLDSDGGLTKLLA